MDMMRVCAGYSVVGTIEFEEEDSRSYTPTVYLSLSLKCRILRLTEM